MDTLKVTLQFVTGRGGPLIYGIIHCFTTRGRRIGKVRVSTLIYPFVDLAICAHGQKD